MKSPAQVVIKMFGGIRATARELDISPSAVHHWKTFVPQNHHGKLLELARDRKLGLTAHDLIYGRK